MAKGGNNNQNLRPPKTSEEARERGRKGGLKSVQVRRERKTAKECMNMLLKMDATGENGRKMMRQMGIKEEEQQNIMLLMATMFARAATSGEPNAVRAVLEIAGEMNAQAEQTNPTININVLPATEADAAEDD